MRRLSWILLFSLTFLFSCSESTPPESVSAKPASNEKEKTTVATPSPTPTPYISLGDLDEIQSHGVIRLIAPRFDGADALPRDGIPVAAYQRIAEDFAQAQGLKVKWLFVDGFDELIPNLLQGNGDLVITNMTVTKARQQQLAFTRSIAQVSEVVVSKRSQKIENLEQLAQVGVTLAEGTSYQETLEQEGFTGNVQLVSSRSSDSELLAGVNSGAYASTILDSDIARKLLADYPDLAVDFTLRKHRSIAWALRPENPVLRDRLNEFLVSHHLKADTRQNQKRDWKQIQASGRLRMLTLNNPASYFMWRGELMGFDFDLMNKFAKEQGLHLEVILKDDIAPLIEALKQGEGDLIAASLTNSEARRDQGLLFSRDYLKVKEHIVGREDGPKIDSLNALAGHSVGVNPNTVFYKRLQAVKKELGIEFDIVRVENATTEELIDKVVKGEFDFTVADSHLVSIEQSYHQNVAINVDLSEESSIGWALRPEQTQLKTQLDQFIKTHYRGLFYNVTYKKYFKNKRKIKRYQDGRVLTGKQLSPYDDIVKAQAKKYHMDWRLLVAQMYQESKFDPKAKSFAGARGLMQVMPRTAKEFGFQDLHDPNVGIAAGVAYMNWLEKRFPGELEFEERIYFTLAAYNAGTGHVRDARKLASSLGLNPNKWFGHVERAMLLLANPKYYKKARFGYVRGSEPVTYVRKIRDRYLAYLAAK